MGGQVILVLFLSTYFQVPGYGMNCCWFAIALWQTCCVGSLRLLSGTWGQKSYIFRLHTAV